MSVSSPVYRVPLTLRIRRTECGEHQVSVSSPLYRVPLTLRVRRTECGEYEDPGTIGWDVNERTWRQVSSPGADSTVGHCFICTIPQHTPILGFLSYL